MKQGDLIQQTNKLSLFSPQNPATKTNMLVTVRSRPLTAKEKELSQVETVKIINGNCISVMSSSEVKTGKQTFQGKEQQFNFDFVFDKSTSQKDLYENTTKFLLSDLIEGYNATVFAYGATGSGKTYTMLGIGDDPGIMPRAVIDLFSLLDNKEFKMKLSYLEVYNENIRDLLGPGENLEIREDQSNRVIISGLKEIDVVNSTEFFQHLLQGNQKRAVESTNSNETSSRSHAVLQITIENKDKNSNQALYGKFIMVDLAGSEKGTNNTGIRQVEGANINKSLLALGSCINSLVDKQSNKSFIPWRNSKLTRILKESLSGNSRIVMISTISPSLFCIDETISTLVYANRAKSIQTTVKRNTVDIVDYQMNKYDEIISQLNNEREELRNQLAIKTHNQLLLSKLNGFNLYIINK